RCDRTGPSRGEPVLHTSHVSPYPTTAPLAALVEVAGCRCSEAPAHSGAVGTSGSLERLRQPARMGGASPRPDSHRLRAGADAEFDSEPKHPFFRQQLPALSLIPAKRGKRTLPGIRAQMRADFPRKQYCRRSLIETVFSAAKRKLSCRAPGRCLLTQPRQALLFGFDLQSLSPVA